MHQCTAGTLIRTWICAHIHTYLSLSTPGALEKAVDISTVPEVLITVSRPLHFPDKNMLSFRVS